MKNKKILIILIILVAIAAIIIAINVIKKSKKSNEFNPSDIPTLTPQQSLQTKEDQIDKTISKKTLKSE